MTSPLDALVPAMVTLGHQLNARFDGDLYQVLFACANGRLKEANISLSPNASVCVVMAAKGYPGDYAKNTVISGLEQAARLPGVKVFHAGTGSKDGQIVSIGGRVLGVTAVAATMAEAQKLAYQAVDAINWPEGFCRRDIGWREIAA